MKNKIISFIIFLLICGAIYVLLSNHFVFHGRNVKLLEKSRLTFEYTFVNVTPTEFRTAKDIMKTEELRQDGIGDVLVDFEIISEEDRVRIEEEIDAESR